MGPAGLATPQESLLGQLRRLLRLVMNQTNQDYSKSAPVVSCAIQAYRTRVGLARSVSLEVCAIPAFRENPIHRKESYIGCNLVSYDRDGIESGDSDVGRDRGIRRKHLNCSGRRVGIVDVFEVALDCSTDEVNWLRRRWDRGRVWGLGLGPGRGLVVWAMETPSLCGKSNIIIFHVDQCHMLMQGCRHVY